MRILVVAEATAVLAFVGTAVWTLWRVEPPLPALDAVSLATTPGEEHWMGIFLHDQHVGYAVSRASPTRDGGRVFEERSTVRMNALGEVQDVVIAGTALTDAQGALTAFDFLLSSPVRVFAHGVIVDHTLVIDVQREGATDTLRIPVPEPPILSMTLADHLAGLDLHPGAQFTMPYFDPLTLSNQTARVEVDAPEVLPNGETGWWLTTEYGSNRLRRLVDAHGDSVREEGSMGLRAQRMSAEEATRLDGGDPPDLVALAAAPLTGREPPEGSHVLTLRVAGVPATRFAEDPPLQHIAGDTVTVAVPLLAELPELPVRGTGDTESTLSLPADHPEIRARAAAVVGDAPNRLEAVRRLNQFVHDYVAKVPTIGIPNGLQVLHAARGDCNEHTALFVSLARAAGIPSRIAAGLVWSSRMGEAFYYHAWPEVRLGGPSDWVPVDPTFGQVPADASHLKVVNGDLDQQIQIMGLLGNVRFTMVEAR